jgi:hypothetical protein
MTLLEFHHAAGWLRNPQAHCPAGTTPSLAAVWLAARNKKAASAHKVATRFTDRA